MITFRYCVRTYVGHREWAREVRVSPDGMCAGEVGRVEPH